MKQYKYLTEDERTKLYIMQKEGASLRMIAKDLGRSSSTISREHKRNKDSDLGYLPDRASLAALSRKVRYGTKINRNPELKTIILEKMRGGRYSPEMISGKLKADNAHITISTEAIYQYIYSPDGQKQKLYQFLMRARPQRNQKYGRKTRSDHGIPGLVSISQRPTIDKAEFGHLEADLTFFKGSGSINLLTLCDRKTGYFIANLNKSKESENITVKLIHNLIKFPKDQRKTITFDNSKEFVGHMKITEILGIPAYFYHP